MYEINAKVNPLSDLGDAKACRDFEGKEPSELFGVMDGLLNELKNAEESVVRTAPGITDDNEIDEENIGSFRNALYSFAKIYGKTCASIGCYKDLVGEESEEFGRISEQNGQMIASCRGN